MHTILGTKIKMGQAFVEDTRVPVTYISAGPCVVTQIKKQEKDGYWAVQLGYGNRKIKNITKPVQGHLKAAYKNSKMAARFLREVKFDKEPDLKVGDEVKVSDVLKKGDVLAVTGTSKGKGFQGVMKRWGFAGGPRTHGQSDRQRSPGSIGQGTDPGRVWKGKKMPGRMGTETVTIKNLIVVDIDEKNNQISVSGLVPGNNGSLLILRKIASGKLDELVQDIPEAQVQEQAEDESEATEDKKEFTEVDKAKEQEEVKKEE